MADWRNRVSGASSRQLGLSVPLAKWNVDFEQDRILFLKGIFPTRRFLFSTISQVKSSDVHDEHRKLKVFFMYYLSWVKLNRICLLLSWSFDSRSPIKSFGNLERKFNYLYDCLRTENDTDTTRNRWISVLQNMEEIDWSIVFKISHLSRIVTTLSSYRIPNEI